MTIKMNILLSTLNPEPKTTINQKLLIDIRGSEPMKMQHVNYGNQT